MLEDQKFALVQYLASLANSMGIRAAIQFTSITSTKHRAHMQVSSVTTVREQPFSPLFPFLQRVSRSMKSVSFAMLKAEKA